MSGLEETLPQTAAAIQSATAIAEHGARGLHTQGQGMGGQIYVSEHRTVVVDEAFGEASPGEPMTPSHWLPWMSATKPLLAVALAQLWEEGRLGLDEPIALHLPEFGAGGKEAVTIRHALTHTGGFRMLDVGYPRLSWEETIAKICATRREPRWEPGRRAGYHQASSWFILGEVVARLRGEPCERVLRERILEPLGMTSSWVGMPPEIYAAERRLIAPSWDTSGPEPKRLDFDTEPYCLRCSPAGGGRGPVQELGRFYESLLPPQPEAGLGGSHREPVLEANEGSPQAGRLSPPSLLAPQTVEALTARHRVGLYDHTFKQVMDWGLGFIPDSKQYGDTVPYAYGPHCSPRTFGHSGYRSITAFADPEHGLAVAVGFNGLPSDEAHEARTRAVCAGIYLDLGLK